MKAHVKGSAARQSGQSTKKSVFQPPAVARQAASGGEVTAGRLATGKPPVVMRRPVSDGERQDQSLPGAVQSEQVMQCQTLQVTAREEAGLRESGQPAAVEGAVQRREERPEPNRTGLPDKLKTGVEQLSGYDLSGVRVNYNSPKPAEVQAHAYTQGTNIEVARGQERHLPHEAWHVVQQMQGRVKPTMQMNGVGVNDDGGLEREADVMGKRAAVQRKSEEFVPTEQGEGADCTKIAPQKAQSEPYVHTHDDGDVIQLMTVSEKFNNYDVEMEDAEPFQLATIQFEGGYDLKLYKDFMLQYMENQLKKSRRPVIELRAYDTASEKNIREYIGYAASVITGWKVMAPFTIRYKTLRDEAMKPQGLEETGEEVQVEKQLLDEIMSFPEIQQSDLGPQIPKFLEINPQLQEPMKQILSGNLMVPIPEYQNFLSQTDKDLTLIWKGQAQQKYSLHERIIAKLILIQQKKEASPQKKEVRGRTNSITKPDTLTLTNLVAGDEAATRHIVLNAVANAIQKGATQVLLTIEHKGTADSPWGRISQQITLLRDHKFAVSHEKMPEDAGQVRASQSGVNIPEPGDTVPPRSLLRITWDKRVVVPTIKVMEYIRTKGLVHQYTEWYMAQVANDLSEALDMMVITGAQFLEETQGVKVM
ncbi:MAG: DUF4157 domain-containing protein [Spirulinaceae cyanobacterium]